MNVQGTIDTKPLSDALDEKKRQIEGKIGDYEGFISEINRNVDIPQEVKDKYIRSTRILIDRLNEYLSQIEAAFQKIDVMNDLNESIVHETEALGELEARKGEEAERAIDLSEEIEEALRQLEERR